MLKIKLPGLMALLCLTAVCSPVHADKGRVFYSTPDFQVTDFDLQMYLRNAPPPEGGGIGSRSRVLQALSDLYATKILLGDADSGSALLSAEEQRWIADYAVTMEKITRYLNLRVEQMLEATDWDEEAKEYYLLNKEQYQIPESVTVRTLLLRTEQRTQQQAVEMIAQLISTDMSLSEFEAVVSSTTEDEVALESGGLMRNVVRGQTVKPFEEAAFALREPGAIAAPVVSRFGVHAIQLIERTELQQRAFEDVYEQIIVDLKRVRASQYRASIQEESREREPEGFVRHIEALDALMLETSDGPLTPPVQR